jgi:hypothetical protein
MSININHTNNTFCGNSGIFVFGTGIVPNIEDTVYSNSFSGKYYGDGSSLTGIATGCFITGIDTSSFLTSSSQLLDASGSLLLNTVAGFSSEGSQNITLNAGASSSILTGSDKNFIVTSDFATISSGSCRNAIVGGVFSAVGPNVCNSIILGGSSINANESNTVYASNFCAANGFYYGNGSGLTNLATGCFVTTGQTGCFVTSGQTGVFALAANTGAFVTTGQTGVFALAADTGAFVTSGQTGVFALAANTGAFVTSGQTGVFALAADTGAFVTSGQTGDFITEPNNFTKESNNYSFLFGSNISNSGCYNFIQGNNRVVSGCYNTVFNGGVIEASSNGNFLSSYGSKISGGACNNAVIGGFSNTIAQYTFASAIIGGSNIVACCNYTAYGQNFCAFGGKYYGDGSALTGITGLGGGSSTPQQTTTLLTGATGFTQYHQAKNVGILAQNCFYGQPQAGNSGYLVLNKGNENETCNLFEVSNNGWCVGTFSAMLVGNGYVDGAPTTTSMRIDGAYGGGQILNQVKNIYYRTKNSNDANVIIEDNALRIAVSGISGTMVWSSKIDLLDMNGYD